MSSLMIEVQEHESNNLLACLSSPARTASPTPLIEAVHEMLLAYRDQRRIRAQLIQSLTSRFPDARPTLVGLGRLLRFGVVCSISTPTWSATRGDFFEATLDPDLQGELATGCGLRFRFQECTRDHLVLTVFDRSPRSLAVYPHLHPLFDQLITSMHRAQGQGSADPIAKLIPDYPDASSLLQGLIMLVARGPIDRVLLPEFNTVLGNWFNVLVRTSASS